MAAMKFSPIILHANDADTKCAITGGPRRRAANQKKKKNAVRNRPMRLHGVRYFFPMPYRIGLESAAKQ